MPVRGAGTVLVALLVLVGIVGAGAVAQTPDGAPPGPRGGAGGPPESAPGGPPEGKPPKPPGRPGRLDSPEVGPGCDPDRPAIAHHAGGVVLDPQPEGAPIVCGMYTGFPSGETRIEVTNSGAVVYAPAGRQPEPQTTMHGRGGVAVSHDDGATWTRVLPLGMTWHQNDMETYVDRDTGRFFWAVMFKNSPGQVPNDPEGSNPVGENVESDELPASHMYAIPKGGLDTNPAHYPAVAALPAMSHILGTDDHDPQAWGRSWTYGTTCCEIVNGAALITAKAPTGTEKPVGYQNVVYYCWRASQTFHSRPPEGLCSRSLDGGTVWEIRGWTHRPGVPVHRDVCPTPGSASPTPDDGSETAGLPVAAPDGSLYMVLRCGGKTYLTKSTDQAETWPVLREITRPPGELRVDSEGNLYLMRSETEPHRLLLSVSADEGKTWSRELDVTHPDVTFLEQHPTAIYGGRNCCTNWFYDVRGPGQVAVSYSGRTAAQAEEGPGVYGFISATRNVLDVLDGGEPVFWSALVSDPDRPLKFFAGAHRGANGSRGPLPGSASGLGGPQTQQLGMDIGPDGSAWASFTEDCGPNPEAPQCEAQKWQTRGFAARLAWPAAQVPHDT